MSDQTKIYSEETMTEENHSEAYTLSVPNESLSQATLSGSREHIIFALSVCMYYP